MLNDGLEILKAVILWKVIPCHDPTCVNVLAICHESQVVWVCSLALDQTPCCSLWEVFELQSKFGASVSTLQIVYCVPHAVYV